MMMTALIVFENAISCGRKGIGTAGLLISLLSGAASAEAIDCRDFPDGDFQRVEVTEGLLAPEFLSTLSFDENGLTGVICGEHVLHYASKSGRFIRVYNFDNGPDFFSEKERLARYVNDDGLIGFIDPDLNIVIPARFTCAWPFVEGQAKVTVMRNGSEWNTVVFPDGRISSAPSAAPHCGNKSHPRGSRSLLPKN